MIFRWVPGVSWSNTTPAKDLLGRTTGSSVAPSATIVTGLFLAPLGLITTSATSSSAPCLARAFAAAADPLQPAQVKPAAVDRRAAMKFTFPAAVAAALAPAAALAAKPPQLQSMQPPRRAKTGQIKTGNAGSIMKK